MSRVSHCVRRAGLLAVWFTCLTFPGLTARAYEADPPIPANHIRIHYFRPDATYSGWTVYAFGDTTEANDFGGGPVQVAGTDSFGAYFDVGVTAGAQNVGLIIHKGDTKDPGPNEFADPSTQGIEFWALSGVALLYTSQPSTTGTPPLAASYARIHYYRPDGNYANWSVYAFGDTTEPNNYGEGPVFVTATDSYGAYFDISLKAAPQDLGFIVHNTSSGVKDPGPDMHLNVASYKEAWIISGDPTVYTTQPSPAQLLNSSFRRLQAFWIDRGTIAIQSQFQRPGWSYFLYYSPAAALQITPTGKLTGGSAIPLSANTGGLTPAELERFPQLSSYAILHLPSQAGRALLTQIVKGQIAVAAADRNGTLGYVTGVQLAGLLDDLFYYPGSLGVVTGAGRTHEESRRGNAGVSVRVWAPTAQSMKLLLFRNATDTVPAATQPMQESSGVWSANVGEGWENRYYLLDVVVYVPSQRGFVENVVTDPYSDDLAVNGIKSRLTDLNSPAAKPYGWDSGRSPMLRSKNDLSFYELHIRDFSANDATVPLSKRGTYLAFADGSTNGMRHLQELALAGLKAVHLLPSFDMASVNEDKSSWKSPGDLSAYPPDSQQQQAAVAQIQGTDAFNWGYDPVHYLAPDGAYAANPDNRVLEYRQMVQGLHRAGLRVVQDVVFNHTSSSGENPNSVLDEIVPSYYYRLDADGNVLNGSCCANTASEHRMMEKLMIDAVVQNARAYKIDGFRFDLMSFHFVYNMLHLRQALSQLTDEADGVNGSQIYLYGEGWETGETAFNALGPNASQTNLYGTGIGTFNDRIRDGIRGGGPFSDQRIQGFATGLLTDPSSYTVQNPSDQQGVLLREADWIRAGLAGNLRDFSFVDSAGQTVTSSQIDYNGQHTGYTAAPSESINYCSVHDGQTLFDAIQIKSSASDTIETRVRRQVLAMSLIALGQGLPFFLAGDELLRSKDMDANSYDSGDWFNKLDFTFQSDNWGTGLPIASQNQSNWYFMQPLLANPALKPGPLDIAQSRAAFNSLLSIRASSGLFHMATLAEIQQNLRFLDTGNKQVPGLIVMRLDANGRDYGPIRHVVVVFNGTTSPIKFQDDSLKAMNLHLHQSQLLSSDPVVRQSIFDANAGTLQVPGITAAVFVSEED